MPRKPVYRPSQRATPRVAAIFARLLRQAQRSLPSLRVDLREGAAHDFPAARNYAYCSHSRGRITIVVAPRMAQATRPRIEGVLMHELGHAVFFAGGELQHAEREADKLAERLFSRMIRYDAALDVQTTGRGNRPRPAHLPA